MDKHPFLADVKVNRTNFVLSLINYGYSYYGAIAKSIFRSFKLLHIFITPRTLESAAGDNKEVTIDKITYILINLDGH